MRKKNVYLNRKPPIPPQMADAPKCANCGRKRARKFGRRLIQERVEESNNTMILVQVWEYDGTVTWAGRWRKGGAAFGPPRVFCSKGCLWEYQYKKSLK